MEWIKENTRTRTTQVTTFASEELRYNVYEEGGKTDNVQAYLQIILEGCYGYGKTPVEAFRNLYDQIEIFEKKLSEAKKCLEEIINENEATGITTNEA